MAGDARFYWDGSTCVQMPFNHCFIGFLGGDLTAKQPRVFVTKSDCEVSHAHCH
jgi:hypothetical protein